MSKKSELLEKVAEVRPDAYAMLEKAATELNGTPFYDELVAETQAIVKKASAMDVVRRAGGYARQAGEALKGPANALKGPATWLGGAAGGALALSAAGDLYDAAKRGLTKGRNFSTMMKSNPDLADADPEQVKSVFSTLHRFNPEFSADPSVAGQFVRQGLSYGTDLDTVGKLTQTRKNVQDARAIRPLPRMWPSAAEQELQSAQTSKAKAEGYRARQQGMDAARERMHNANESAQASKARHLSRMNDRRLG